MTGPPDIGALAGGEQARDPLGVCGRTKAHSEEAVEQVLGCSGRGVVADQVACPTSTHTWAAACWRVIAVMETAAVLPAVLHWREAGAASWYSVLVAVGESGVELGLLKQMAAVEAITTAEYPTQFSGPATRCWRAPPPPGRWSCLRCTGARPFSSCWRRRHERSH